MSAAALPLDPAIPALRLVGERGVSELLARLGLPDDPGAVQLLKHHPGSRCTVLVPRGRVVMKAYAKDRSALAALLEKLAPALRSGGGPAAARRLVRHDAKLHVLVVEHLAGPSADELILAGRGARAGELAVTWLRVAGGLRIELGRRYAHDELLADVSRWAGRLARADPDVGRRAAAVLAALTAAPPARAPLVLRHGSFRAAQVLDLGDGPGVIDWDGFRQAEPELDAAMFLAGLARYATVRPHLAAQAGRAATALRTGTAGLFDADRLDWYRAGALVKVAKFALKRRRARWHEHANALLDEALLALAHR